MDTVNNEFWIDPHGMHHFPLPEQYQTRYKALWQLSTQRVSRGNVIMKPSTH